MFTIAGAGVLFVLKSYLLASLVKDFVINSLQAMNEVRSK